MTEQTVSPPSRDSAQWEPGTVRRGSRHAREAWGWRFRWPLGALGVLIVSVLIVVWAQVRPGYDPYGWLVWGHLTLQWNLNTDGAPSWKPLPFLFTLPYNLFGRDALYLWMVTAVAISLTSFVFAYRVAFALVDPPAGRRWVGHLAGVIAAACLLDIYQFMQVVLNAQSDTMVIALCLAAVDAILGRRYRWALWLWWLASLGRPEAWAWLGLYVLWAWRAVPAMRRQLVAAVLLVPLAWFGIPALTSRSPFTPALLADNSSRVIHGNKIIGVLQRLSSLTGLAVRVAAAVAVGLAVIRRDRRVLLFSAGIVVWVVAEMAFALHGWSAVRRYLMEPGAGICVLAGLFAGRAVLDGPAILRRLRISIAPRLAGVAGLGAVGLFAIGAAPTFSARITYERNELRSERARGAQIDRLESGVDRIGANRIMNCGQPAITIGLQSALAWYLGTSVGALYYKPIFVIRHPHPIVLMQGLNGHGWHIYAADDPTPAQAARCRGIDAHS